MKNHHVRIDGVKTREAILDAAEKEFSEKGYALASVRHICTVAKANVALANRYFGTKDALYERVAQRLFGDLSEPMTHLAEHVNNAKTWRDAIRTWIDDFLYMTLPDAEAQQRCALLFRHEITSPTSFHETFKMTFGRPVYQALAHLISLGTLNQKEQDRWTLFIWAQVSIYALADQKWIDTFRPVGLDNAKWRDEIRDFICDTFFKGVTYHG